MNLSISGTGKFLPKTIVTSEDLDLRLNKYIGFVRNKSGVMQRHFSSDNESSTFMAYQAAKQALNNANMKATDLDCIISASAGMEQAIPNNSSFIHKRLGLGDSGIATFDVNSTCLSFITALDLAHCIIKAGKFRNILIVSSDIPSLSLNWSDMDTCTIFGDGAAAAIIQPFKTGNKNCIKPLASLIETYSSGTDYCQVQSGGTKWHPNKSKENFEKYAFFEMNGKAIYKLVSSKLDGFIKRLLHKSGLTLDDIDLVIPHQASQLAMRHLRKKLNIKKENMVDIFETHGNQVSASIPTAIHEVIARHKVKHGDKVLLIGTSAGLSIGGIVVEYNT